MKKLQTNCNTHASKSPATNKENNNPVLSKRASEIVHKNLDMPRVLPSTNFQQVTRQSLVSASSFGGGAKNEAELESKARILMVKEESTSKPRPLPEIPIMKEERPTITEKPVENTYMFPLAGKSQNIGGNENNNLNTFGSPKFPSQKLEIPQQGKTESPNYRFSAKENPPRLSVENLRQSRAKVDKENVPELPKRYDLPIQIQKPIMENKHLIPNKPVQALVFNVVEQNVVNMRNNLTSRERMANEPENYVSGSTLEYTTSVHWGENGHEFPTLSNLNVKASGRTINETLMTEQQVSEREYSNPKNIAVLGGVLKERNENIGVVGPNPSHLNERMSFGREFAAAAAASTKENVSKIPQDQKKEPLLQSPQFKFESLEKPKSNDSLHYKFKTNENNNLIPSSRTNVLSLEDEMMNTVGTVQRRENYQTLALEYDNYVSPKEHDESIQKELLSNPKSEHIHSEVHQLKPQVAKLQNFDNIDRDIKLLEESIMNLDNNISQTVINSERERHTRKNSSLNVLEDETEGSPQNRSRDTTARTNKSNYAAGPRNREKSVEDLGTRAGGNSLSNSFINL